MSLFNLTVSTLALSAGTIGTARAHDEICAFSLCMRTHLAQQVVRVGQKTAAFHLGHLAEFGETSHIFTNPIDERI